MAPQRIPTRPVKGSIPGTLDFGITEAISNLGNAPLFQSGWMRGQGALQAAKNLGTFIGSSAPQRFFEAPANAAEVMGPPIPSRLANAPSAPVLPSPASAGGGGAVSVASSPQERAYQSAKAEAAAMSESDPLFKKYQVADLTKAYNAATDPEEKNRIGLQIWATTNPTLAQKLKPGQTGYQEAASLLGTQTFGTDQPGITQAALSSMAEKIGAPAMESVPEGFVKSFGAVPANFGAGIDAAQVGYSPTGELPPQMIGENVFSLPTELNVPKDLSQVQLKLLKEAFSRRLK